MTSCRQSLPPEVRPGSARVRVTELKHPDRINPTPVAKPCEEAEAEADLHLSPERLESLCGTRDLSRVTFLEVCVDTRSNSLGNFGAYMPRLVQLKLNNSSMVSVRDLGTTISHLQVLWMSRCSLPDLDGISNFTSLQELYVAYNYLSDLSQVGMLENLKLLDLEGNDVDDLVQIQYLGLCGNLQRLTLEGNPVCSRPNPTSVQMTDDYSYRAAVRELIPQLRYLDDVRVEEDGQGRRSTVGGDWDIFRDSIRGCSDSQAPGDVEEPSDCSRPHSRISSPSLPSFCTPSPASSRPPTGFRPSSAAGPGGHSPSGSRSGSADSDLATVEAETSNLTHGAGKILFCGNPVQAIRAKREKLRTAPARSTFTPCDLPVHVPEQTFQDLKGPGREDRKDVLAELRAWREQHSRRLQAIEKDRSPQVLTIQHDDPEESEEEGLSGMNSDSSDEEHEDSRDTASPDSSFQSLSPGEAVSTNMARLSLSSDSTPSPPPPLDAAASIRNIRNFRARRLRPSRADSDPFLHLRNVWTSPGTTTSSVASESHRVQQVSRTNV
ncbi:unnamed protein product [Ophioblennius macclurei]